MFFFFLSVIRMVAVLQRDTMLLLLFHFHIDLVYVSNNVS